MRAGDGKDPSAASLGSRTHVYRLGAGERGARKRPAFFKFEPDRFGIRIE